MMDKPRLSRIERLKNKRKIIVVKPKDGQDGEKGLTGDRGPIGDQGDIGPIGKTGPIGPRGPLGYRGLRGEKGQPGQDGIDGKGITWTGQWESYRNYSINDAVINFGTAYICIADHKSGPTNQPGIGSLRDKFWSVLAERGEAGPGGSPGANGIQGPQGPAGAGAVVQANGVDLATEPKLNFKSRLSAVDNAGVSTDVNVVSSPKTDALSSATTTVDVISATAPAPGNVLTATDSTHAIWQAPASSQNLVTKVVAPSGGDYTTLGAALAAASAGWVIWVQPGTYTESAQTIATSNITVIGSGPETTIIDIVSTTWTLSGTGLTFMNLQIKSTDGIFDLSFTDYSTISGCHFRHSGNGGNRIGSWSGTGVIIDNNVFINAANNTVTTGLLQFSFTNGTITGNSFNHNSGSSDALLSIANCSSVVISGNSFSFNNNNSGSKFLLKVQTNATNIEITGNSFISAQSAQFGVSVAGTDCVVSGNTFNTLKKAVDLSGVRNTVTGNNLSTTTTAATGIIVGANDCVVTGNTLSFNTTASGTGITISTTVDNTVVTGNRVNTWTTGINVTDSTNDKTVIVGNSFVGCTTGITDAGTGTVNTGNAT